MIRADRDRCRALATLSAGIGHHQSDLVTDLMAMTDATRRMLTDIGVALRTRDPGRVRAVAAAAGRVELMHIDLEHEVVDQIVHRQPAPDDLWRLMALLDTGVLVGRMGETCVALARLTLAPDAPGVPLTVAGGLTDMATFVEHLLADAIRPWRGGARTIEAAPVHLARQLEDAHDDLFRSLVTAARESLSLPAVLWVDRAANLLHEAGRLVVDVAETACLPVSESPTPPPSTSFEANP